MKNCSGLALSKATPVRGRVTRASATPAGTLVLDSEGLAKAVLRAREVTQWLAPARADDLRVITSAAAVVEVAHPRLNRAALEWTLSRLVVEPVTEPIARRAMAITPRKPSVIACITSGTSNG